MVDKDFNIEDVVNIDEQIEEYMCFRNAFPTPVGMTDEECEQVVRNVMIEVSRRHYEYDEDFPEESGIDDWDMWEMDVINEANKRLYNE